MDDAVRAPVRRRPRADGLVAARPLARRWGSARRPTEGARAHRVRRHARAAASPAAATASARSSTTTRSSGSSSRAAVATRCCASPATCCDPPATTGDGDRPQRPLPHRAEQHQAAVAGLRGLRLHQRARMGASAGAARATPRGRRRPALGPARGRAARRGRRRPAGLPRPASSSSSTRATRGSAAGSATPLGLVRSSSPPSRAGGRRPLPAVDRRRSRAGTRSDGRTSSDGAADVVHLAVHALVAPGRAGARRRLRRLLQRRARQQAELGTMGVLHTTVREAARASAPRARRALFLVGATFLLVGPGAARSRHRPPSSGRNGDPRLRRVDQHEGRRPRTRRAPRPRRRRRARSSPTSRRASRSASSRSAARHRSCNPRPTSKSDVLAAIKRLSPGGGTAIGRAILTSLDAIAGKPIRVDPDALSEGGDPGNVEFLGSSAVVLLTDGENTAALDPRRRLGGRGAGRRTHLPDRHRERERRGRRGRRLPRRDSPRRAVAARARAAQQRHVLPRRGRRAPRRDLRLDRSRAHGRGETTGDHRPRRGRRAPLLRLVAAALSMLWFGRVP